MTPALGVVLVPTLPPEALRPQAWTDRVRVGIGLAPVPLRNVALLAMEVAAIHRLFPGR